MSTSTWLFISFRSTFSTCRSNESIWIEQGLLRLIHTKPHRKYHLPVRDSLYQNIRNISKLFGSLITWSSDWIGHESDMNCLDSKIQKSHEKLTTVTNRPQDSLSPLPNKSTCRSNEIISREQGLLRLIHTKPHRKYHLLVRNSL